MASQSFSRLLRWPEFMETSSDEAMSFGVTDGECPNCGAATLVLARACRHCGAALKLRMAGMLVAGALALLLVAIVAAVVVLLSWHQLAAATESGALADEQIAAVSTADFSWLITAMSECDADAKADQGTFHFLVTPLVSVANDIEPWRAKSINDAGGGILLRAEDMLAGLKSGALQIYPADYGFSIFDEDGNALHKWRPTAGVAKLSAADVAPISTFKVQFRTSHSGGDPDSGGSFNRLSGSCYWVNAIIGN
jgi:predicted RNA-binding Zn-ribbon protein involved in translation (DUF1610 family)